MSRGTKKAIYEWFLVVEGSGSFPLDMLRYDACFPYEQTDSGAIERTGRRRVVLIRRGVNEHAGSEARWTSFGWKVVLATTSNELARLSGDEVPS
jgi:hypothetical protein